ncbi:hypothetical protein EJB05_46740, partial [Eragrostis curvula]
MAGNRRGRGRRRARSPPDESSASQERATPREVAVAERPSKRTGHIWRLRNPAFSCMNPERWGGKSNFIYVANPPAADEPWTVVELGQKVSGETWDLGYLHWPHNPETCNPLARYSRE